MKPLSLEDVFSAIASELEKQDQQWGPLDERRQSLAGYLLILDEELSEAKRGWAENVEGEHSALSELVQVAAVAVSCLQSHGLSGNPL